jgi:putative ABC transport system permease protein
MFSLTIKTILAKKVRFLLTGVAVILGVAFMAGTLVLTDTIQQSYDDVAGKVYESTDAVVRSSRHLEGDDGQQRGTVPASLLAKVRAVKGVQAAEAQQVGIAVVVAHNGTLLDANPNRAIPVALAWQQTPELNPMEIVSGHAPRAPDEVVIDRMSMRKGQYRLGETVNVVSQIGSHPYRLAGVVTYAGRDSAVGAQVIAFAPETAAKVLGTPGRYNAIQVVAAAGVSEREVVTNLRAALHGTEATEVITGAAATEETRKAAGASLQFINMFLLSFAIVALVVGSFVIYNTFSITVAQRTKENALLRAIGAKRKQVTRSVMLEALFTGVFASAVGVVAGIGAAEALRLVLEAFGLELPAADTVVKSSTIVISMVTGVVVTVVAAYLPARKAAKVAPIEAMRDVAVEPTRTSKRRVVFGTLVTAAGAAFIGMGLSGGQASSVGLGAFGVFIGIAVLGPVIAKPFARIAGAPLPKVRGTAGRLARENATRNPRRTAATASALMIGLALVAFITTFAASGRESVATTIDTAMKSEWIVDTQYGMGGLSPNVAKAIDELPETESVTGLRFVDAKVNGSVKNVGAFDPANVEQNIEIDQRSGDYRKLGVNEVAVQVDEATKQHVELGDTVRMFFPETGVRSLKVVAIYGTKDPLGSYAISIEAFDAMVGKHVDDVVLVANAPGVSMSEARTAIEQVLEPYPTATLRTEDEFKGSVANEINQILNLVYVLLAMALLIALFGIANTLALSVFERTKEFGLLRAVGMSRAQVRSTVRWESVLIALLGTTLGTAIGLGFSWALVQALGDAGITKLSIPVGQLSMIVVLAAVAAVVAAAWPARRAAKLDVLEAIGD